MFASLFPWRIAQIGYRAPVYGCAMSTIYNFPINRKAKRDWTIGKLKKGVKEKAWFDPAREHV
jgi:hypothetical protein